MTLLQVQDNGSGAMLMLFYLVIRIVGAVVCTNKAKELNRSTGGWGFFGFCMPVIAMIWVNCLKPNIDWENKSDIV